VERKRRKGAVRGKNGGYEITKKDQQEASVTLLKKIW